MSIRGYQFQSCFIPLSCPKKISVQKSSSSNLRYTTYHIRYTIFPCPVPFPLFPQTSNSYSLLTTLYSLIPIYIILSTIYNPKNPWLSVSEYLLLKNLRGEKISPALCLPFKYTLYNLHYTISKSVVTYFLSLWQKSRPKSTPKVPNFSKFFSKTPHFFQKNPNFS